MRGSSWFIGMSLAVALIVAARMTLAATSHNAGNGRTTEKKEYIFKADETVFTGTVVTNDTKAKTITIEGHNPLQRETVEKIVSHGSSAKKPAKPTVRDSQRVFRVDSGCRVALTNMPTARLSDVHGGDTVDVEYRRVIDLGVTNWVASAIQTAETHPYDALPGKASKKKNK